jgi:hypothetical protein
MTANQTLRPTREQTLSILKSSYCLINNWGGSVFYYITEPEVEAEGHCILFENKKARTFKFSLDQAKIWFEVGCLQLTNTEENIAYSFTVLSKVNLEEFISKA